MGKPGRASKPVEIASGEPSAERDDGAQSEPDRRFLLVGVVPSGQCFCPSRAPERNENIEGHGAPLPVCADDLLAGLPGTALAPMTLAVASRLIG
jgi:hypothetical protein